MACLNLKAKREVGLFVTVGMKGFRVAGIVPINGVSPRVALTNSIENLDIQDAYAIALNKLGHELQDITEQEKIWQKNRLRVTTELRNQDLLIRRECCNLFVLEDSIGFTQPRMTMCTTWNPGNF
ncbi:Glycogen/starch/alpha-glucan phosphorylase [Artemisia annua]|uniref:Glycogen/starch/alpha-glucan phosphorylase n=1 Tax=Artemisia annua TaxID=35608 RepID=A0A2U1NIG3_ARTAN|nr:Glycogen/starch/alpha-glucan phosphorylase [Artemisia annua]